MAILFKHIANLLYSTELPKVCRNLERKLANLIPEERSRNGEYAGVGNFELRTGAGLDQVLILIRAGAFRFTDTGKKELLWEAVFAVQRFQREDSTHAAI